MKLKKILLSITSPAIILVFLITGSGFMTVSHSCKMCDVTTIDVYSILSPAGESEVCCSVGTDPASSKEQNISAACCDYRIEQFKINNFVVTCYFTPEIVAVQFFSSPQVLQPAFTEQSSKPVYTLNKHGGRFIVNANCQFLS